MRHPSLTEHRQFGWIIHSCPKSPKTERLFCIPKHQHSIMEWSDLFMVYGLEQGFRSYSASANMKPSQCLGAYMPFTHNACIGQTNNLLVMGDIHINTLRPRQIGWHFADDIFKRIFFNENVWISIKISLKFFPTVPINKIQALFRMMAWRRPGDKPLSEAMLVSLLTHKCVTRPQWVKASANGRRYYKYN